MFTINYSNKRLNDQEWMNINIAYKLSWRYTVEYCIIILTRTVSHTTVVPVEEVGDEDYCPNL